jgi:hypothetical protein
MTNNLDIVPGDIVTHKKIILNGGVGMNVINTTETQAEIDYFDSEGVNRQMWVDKSDLEIIHKVDGGFRKAGE